MDVLHPLAFSFYLRLGIVGYKTLSNNLVIFVRSATVSHSFGHVYGGTVTSFAIGI